jgi:phosphoglycerol transferase MdoB-like AlkP superfamily enzyme
LLDSTTWSAMNIDLVGFLFALVSFFVCLGLAVWAQFKRPFAGERVSKKTTVLIAVLGAALVASPWWLVHHNLRRTKILTVAHSLVLNDAFYFFKDYVFHKADLDSAGLRALASFEMPVQAGTYPLAHFQPALDSAERAHAPYNIVLVIGESYGGRPFNHALKSDSSLAPHLLSLAHEGGLWFSRAFAGGSPTVNGTASIFLGLPAHPDRFIFTNYLDLNLPAFPELLPDSLYSKAFINSTDPSFDYITPWFDRFFADRWNFPVHTEGKIRQAVDTDLRTIDMVIQALDTLPTQKPWLLGYINYITHSPFRAPADCRPEMPTGTPEESYYRSMACADREFGRLLERLRARPDWERTVVIVVGDHDAPKNPPDFEWPCHGISRPQIFMGIFSPDTALFHGALTVREDVASQMDICPTILRLAGVDASNSCTGIDLIRQKRPADVPALFFMKECYALGFPDRVQVGSLSTDTSIFVNRALESSGSFEEICDSASHAWEKNAMQAAEALRVLFRENRIAPAAP